MLIVVALGPGQVQKPGASFTHLTGANQAPTMHQAELGAQDGVVAQSHTWPFPQGVWTLKQDGGLSKVLPWDECHTGEKVSWGPGLGPIGRGSQTTRPSLQLAPFLPLLFCVVYLFVCLLSEGWAGPCTIGTDPSPEVAMFTGMAVTTHRRPWGP